METSHYPLPRIWELLEKLHGECTLDLARGYHQLPVKDRIPAYWLTRRNVNGVFCLLELTWVLWFPRREPPKL